MGIYVKHECVLCRDILIDPEKENWKSNHVFEKYSYYWQS